MFMILFVVFVILMIIEAATTFIALKNCRVKELNPVFAGLITVVGLNVAMLIKITITAGLCYLFFVLHLWWLLVILELPLILVCYNNIKVVRQLLRRKK